LRRIERKTPETGKVHILSFTDRQFENIVRFDGRVKRPATRNPEQYALF